MQQILHADYWPFVVLVVSVSLVVLLITKWRFHAFIALMVSAIFVGLVSPGLPVVAGQHAVVTAVELPMAEFGVMAGKIGWVIALAAIIGTAMMESGAAEQIVNWLLRKLGEKRAAIALLTSGYILSIPVFFDTVFFLLIPLGITLARKTGRDFVLYVLAIGAGAAITHTIVPPTPGPLIMAETLKIDLGTVILAGLVTGLIPAMAALAAGKWFNKRVIIPLRITTDSVSSTANPPSLVLSVMPVVIPLLLISLDSVVHVVAGEVPGWIAFAGNKNIAMVVGASLALLLWVKTRKLGRQELWDEVAKPLEVAGVIILITAAGGAYGTMIQHSGIGKAISVYTEGFDISYLLLAWVIAAVMKIAQGSGTVSMITTSAIMAAIIGQDHQLPYHSVYLLLAIGFGSLFIPWMNDSGFWVVVRMSGFTEREGLRTWTMLLAIISIVGFTQILLLSWLLPLV
jgi:GntP family gluconate:H+ symporter